MQDSSAAAGSSLWLEVRLGNQQLVFEFKSAEERPIVVGSLFRADVRVDDPEVAPVEFHFERQEDEICVVPAYGKDVTVNAGKLVGSSQLGEYSLIEFVGYSLVARVLRVRPSSYVAPRLPAVHDTIEGTLPNFTMEGPLPNFAGRSIQADATRLAVPIVAPPTRTEEPSRMLDKKPAENAPNPGAEPRLQSTPARAGSPPESDGAVDGSANARASAAARRRRFLLVAASMTFGFAVGFATCRASSNGHARTCPHHSGAVPRGERGGASSG